MKGGKIHMRNGRENGYRTRGGKEETGRRKKGRTIMGERE